MIERNIAPILQQLLTQCPVVTLTDMQASGEAVPVALTEKHDSGEFRVRIPPMVHRNLALMASEQGVSLNRLASAKLAA